ncbi:flagellar assembly protein FliW [Chitinispirillales bacterium ANBcel5]|uniref:flagellar assembly protein FliW n=1 Tax=Cellulosispirillum alkaliphilum TaxID=3039283 RepID=UPI002A51ABCD|nr:flagellar assembly protein FliW [Chitinispirillales bacterium ANBcel5]
MSDFFKDLVYSSEDVIKFPSGIPGFENNKEFVIISIPDYAPFEWLVCVDGSRLRFAIINPLLFSPDYSPDIKKTQLEELRIEKPEDILLFSVVTIRENPLESTANLIGPIIINKSKRIGKQIIIDDDQYSTREPILRK